MLGPGLAVNVWSSFLCPVLTSSTPIPAELGRYLEDHPHLINTARLRARPGAEAEAGDSEDNKTFLWTPLHWAASLDTAGGLDLFRLLLGAIHKLSRWYAMKTVVL